jgi:hypothetical protein
MFNEYCPHLPQRVLPTVEVQRVQGGGQGRARCQLAWRTCSLAVLAE